MSTYFSCLLYSSPKFRIQPIVMTILKTVCVSGVFLLGGVTSLVKAQSQNKDTAIIGRVFTGEPTKEAAKSPVLEKRNFKIRATHRQKIGNRSITLHEVEEPPAEEQAPVAANEEAPKLDKKRGNKKTTAPVPTKLIMVTATVYGEGDNCHSKITIQDGIEKITCWSKINASYLAGCNHWKANNRPYFMLTSIEQAKNTADAAKDGCPMKRLRRAGNRFVVTESNRENRNISRQVISDLHKLYRMEKKRLRDAYHKRKQNAALRAGLPKAESDPPKPETIYFWKRDLSKKNKKGEIK